MRGVKFSDMTCSIARTLDIVGERWTLLILRESFRGVRRFEDFHRSLGVARNVLTERLQLLVEEGILERRPARENARRLEYRLTPKGFDLYPVLMALREWGDRYKAGEDGVPMLVRHAGCGQDVEVRVYCPDCREPLSARETKSEPGPGMIAARAAEAAEATPAV
jgi:DNA-binding HxlR family transcriptional regulator